MKSGTYRFKVNIHIKEKNKLGDMDRKDIKESIKKLFEKEMFVFAESSEFSIEVA